VPFNTTSNIMALNNPQPDNANVPAKPVVVPDLIDQLEALLAELKQIMGTTTDDKVFDAAADEYSSTSNKLQVALCLDIGSDTPDMVYASKALAQAKTDLDAGLASVAKATDFVTTCTKYLGYADAVLSAAKVAAAAV
jgi:hypothetical protein